MIWFTGCPHYGHDNIIKYCNRPFKDVHEMNKTLMNNHNSVVKPDDEIYIIGDFCFRDIRPIISRLHGKIHMLIGSHDKHARKHKHLFYKVYPANVAPNEFGSLYVNINNQPIVLSHYQYKIWHKSHFNSWQLYAHSHGKSVEEGKSLEVCVERHNYFPISFDQVKAIMEKKPNNINYIGEIPDRRSK